MLHTHLQSLGNGEFVVELREGERVIDLGDDCITFGCETVADALEIFRDMLDELEYTPPDGDEFDTFAGALVRGVETDDELAARYDVLNEEFSR